MKRILEVLSQPFFEKISFLILIFLMISFIDIYDCFYKGYYSYCIYIAAHGFLNSYILTLSMCLCPKKIYRRFLFSLLTLFLIIDIFCEVAFERLFDRDIAGIILGTNIDEAYEFLSVFLSFKLVTIIIITLFVFYILYNLLYRIKLKETRIGYYFGFSCLSVTVFMCFHNTAPWKELFFGELYTFISVPSIPELKNYFHYPKINVISEQPKNIVIVFGESFSKSHCSLYGYDKNTNPYLSDLKKNGELITFNNVKSAGLSTINSFKGMMSTYKMEYGDSCNWYECLSLIEIIKASGYHSNWISNQSQKGFHDNMIGKYAALCDSCEFVGNRFAGCKRRTYDEDVIDIINDLPTDSLNFYFVHLMGSHSSFNERYPSNFNRFVENDYSNYPEHQRHNLATYDNSVLYNDSVVYEIITLFKEKESIIFYVPDHALDIYDSSDIYVGHAKPNKQKSADAGYKIPFMVYFSPDYKEKFSWIYNTLIMNQNKYYCTENLIYTIIDIMGVRVNSYNDINKLSLVSH